MRKYRVVHGSSGKTDYNLEVRGGSLETVTLKLRLMG